MSDSAYFVGLLDEKRRVPLLIFFLLQSAGDLLRVQPRSDEFVVSAVVLGRPFCEHSDFGGFLLLVADADHY